MEIEVEVVVQYEGIVEVAYEVNIFKSYKALIWSACDLHLIE